MKIYHNKNIANTLAALQAVVEAHSKPQEYNREEFEVLKARLGIEEPDSIIEIDAYKANEDFYMEAPEGTSYPIVLHLSNTTGWIHYYRGGFWNGWSDWLPDEVLTKSVQLY